MRSVGSAVPFRDIIGHRKLVTLLSRSIARGSLPPSLILSGPSGVGKRLAATATAQALNCLNPVRPSSTDSTAEPIPYDACGACAACSRIARGVHPDVSVLEPNEKGNIRIDPVREVIDRAGYRPFEGRRRVAIIDHADGLERAAQNALLKVLEEPPSGSVFLLVTAYPDLLLPTVRSRCPQLRFRPLTVNEVEGRRFGVNVIPHTLSHTTFGSMRFSSHRAIRRSVSAAASSTSSTSCATSPAYAARQVSTRMWEIAAESSLVAARTMSVMVRR